MSSYNINTYVYNDVHYVEFVSKKCNSIISFEGKKPTEPFPKLGESVKPVAEPDYFEHSTEFMEDAAKFIEEATYFEERIKWQ